MFRFIDSQHSNVRAFCTAFCLPGQATKQTSTLRELHWPFVYLMPRRKDCISFIEQQNLVLLSSVIRVSLHHTSLCLTGFHSNPNGAQHPAVSHTNHTKIFTVIKYSHLHTNWAPDSKSFQYVLEWSVIITGSARSVRLFMCITSDFACGKGASGLKWGSSMTSAMYVPRLPVEPSALLTAPQAQAGCYLNSAGEQGIWHNQLPSDPHFDEWAEV